MEKHGGDIIEVEDDTTAAPGPAQSRQEADVMDVEEDATATPGPSQPLFPNLRRRKMKMKMKYYSERRRMKMGKTRELFQTTSPRLKCRRKWC